ncbi:MAG TPA: glycosyltransferase, partial [Candidatus Paceibacterota bacterium]|nr:glycosyltransferase [Candidatus Paceibacterota bacterium]
MPHRAPKRVLIFSLAYRPFIGGVEVAIQEITNRIPFEEIEFHVLTLRMDSRLPREERLGNVVVHRIGFARSGAPITDLTRFPLRLNLYLYQLWAAFAAAQLHAKYKFDLVWAMMAHTAGIPAGIFKRFHPSVPYLLTLQEGDPPEYIEKLMRPVFSLFKQGFTQANELQAISGFLLAWGKRMGFRGTGVLIPNGVDTKRFARTHARTADGTTRLITVSRLVRKNAVDDIIRALALLPDSVSLSIAGIGSDEKMLRALVEEQGLTSRVTFLGNVSQEALPELLSSHDIFVRPSRSEGMGISFIEAMAAGLPVIATQEGGIADFLFDGKRNPELPTTGFAVDTDAPDQIADAVMRVLAHPEETE